jgi:hypothetical protein
MKRKSIKPWEAAFISLLRDTPERERVDLLKRWNNKVAPFSQNARELIDSVLPRCGITITVDWGYIGDIVDSCILPEGHKGRCVTSSGKTTV